MHVETETKIFESIHIPFLSDYFGDLTITNTLVTAWLASALLIILALILRATLLKKLRDMPRGLQNVIELAVEGMSKFTNSKVGRHAGDTLAPYFFTLAAFMAMNGLLELFAMGVLRAAPSDLNETVAFALITFFLIRYMAYREKGCIGRMKHFFLPIPVIAPIKLATDMAVPVSLSCRMYGNLLGGYVAMELLYSMGWLSFGTPVIGAVFFSLFHFGMQAFIFIMLSLAFIEEALE